MFLSGLLLIILYILFKYTISWIKYYNSIDERFGKSVWRWTYDYPVQGKKDISDLDDYFFVRKRRSRNRIVTLMYSIFFLAFIIFISFVSDFLIIILN